MAYWGQALVLGPNINAAMDPTDEGPAHAAIEKAIALKPRASLRERALIDALALRYTGKADERESRATAPMPTRWKRSTLGPIRTIPTSCWCSTSSR